MRDVQYVRLSTIMDHQEKKSGVWDLLTGFHFQYWGSCSSRAFRLFLENVLSYKPGKGKLSQSGGTDHPLLNLDQPFLLWMYWDHLEINWFLNKKVDGANGLIIVGGLIAKEKVEHLVGSEGKLMIFQSCGLIDNGSCISLLTLGQVQSKGVKYR